jgi:hypothetical protein
MPQTVHMAQRINALTHATGIYDIIGFIHGDLLAQPIPQPTDRRSTGSTAGLQALR